MEGTCLRSAKLRMRFLLSRYSMAAMPTYCDAEVASAAPATPQPKTKMKMMSIVKFATLDNAADIKGVLHKATMNSATTGRARILKGMLPVE